MKKVISVVLSLLMIFSSLSAFALDIDDAYAEFKAAHPDFINSLTSAGIAEETIVSFIKDVYDYIQEIDSYTPVTRSNFEEHAITAINRVSAREKYIPMQDTLIILYPDAIKLAVTQGKVSKEFKPLVETIKTILFGKESTDSGSGGNDNGGGGAGGSGAPSKDDKEEKDEVSPEVKPEVTVSPFNDVSTSHWAFPAINHLTKNIILNGYLDGTFKPENNITRAEFAKIIVSATDTFDVEATSSFSDVPQDEWYYSYVSAAYKMGYITGYPDGSFNPNANISRADICTIVHRAVKDSIMNNQNIQTFTDDSLIPDYAREAVYALASAGIVNGYDDRSFAPTTFATRAQTAKIIYSALFE